MSSNEDVSVLTANSNQVVDADEHEQEDRLRLVSLTRDAMALDKVIHNPFRLAIMTALSGADSLTFTELMSLLSATYSTIGDNARKLEDAKYICCTKSFEARIPVTRYRLTTKGQQALSGYVERMQSLIKAMR